MKYRVIECITGGFHVYTIEDGIANYLGTSYDACTHDEAIMHVNTKCVSDVLNCWESQINIVE